MVQPGRNGNSGNYRYGFQGQETDDEFKGTNNSLNFGARMYDPRLGKWLSVDPMGSKYPETSVYAFANNSPIIIVDLGGNEWVNAHTVEINKIGKELLKKPNSKKLQRQLKFHQKREALVNEYIMKLKSNDQALYSYIDNLKVETSDGEIPIKVFVSIDTWQQEGPIGEGASTTYRWSNPENDRPRSVLYSNGTGMVAPWSPDYGEVLYGNDSWSDKELANEAGDVMYVMENAAEAYKNRNYSATNSNGQFSRERYENKPSTKYSFKVEDLYMQRKNDGSGKDPENNPYPLKQ